MLNTDRSAYRRTFVEAWAKTKEGRPLSSLEKLIVDVIADHPEYQRLLRGDTEILNRDFTAEETTANPFLHMGLHLAIREQVITDRPPGIRQSFEKLAHKLADRHGAEHVLLDCLAEIMWQSQRSGTPPDEHTYLSRIIRLVNTAKPSETC